MEGHFFGRCFDTEISPGHHDGIRFGQDVIEGVERLRFLDLGDHGDVGLAVSQELPELTDVGGAAHERQGHEVDMSFDGEGEVQPVLGRNGRHGERSPRHVDALVGSECPAGNDPALHTTLTRLGHLHLQRPVIEEHPSALPKIPQELRMRHGYYGGGYPFSGAEFDCRALHQFEAGVGEIPHAQLRALEIGKDGDEAALIVGDSSDCGDCLSLRIVAAMGEVDPRDIHTGTDEGAYGLRRARCRADRADDLGLTHGSSLLTTMYGVCVPRHPAPGRLRPILPRWLLNPAACLGERPQLHCGTDAGQDTVSRRWRPLERAGAKPQ